VDLADLENRFCERHCVTMLAAPQRQKPKLDTFASHAHLEHCPLKCAQRARDGAALLLCALQRTGFIAGPIAAWRLANASTAGTARASAIQGRTALMPWWGVGGVA
jgi:hypothetical protein